MSASVQVERSHNTPNAVFTRYSMEIEDKVMAALPKPLSDWLRYEATSDICPVSIYREWRNGLKPDGNGMSVETLLSSLRGIRCHNTRSIYGRHHPQSQALQ